MSDKQHGPVRGLVERAIGVGGEFSYCAHYWAVDYLDRDEESHRRYIEGEMAEVRAAADAMDAQAQQTVAEYDSCERCVELAERRIAALEAVRDELQNAAQTWPQGDEAAEQLRDAWYETWLPGKTVTLYEHALAALALLAGAQEA